MSLQRVSEKQSRPKMSEGLSKKVRNLVGDGDKLAHLLFAIANGSEPNAKVSDRLTAINMLFDRGWGKPVTSLEVSGEVNVTSVIQTLDTNDLKDLVALREQLLAQEESKIIDVPTHCCEEYGRILGGCAWARDNEGRSAHWAGSGSGTGRPSPVVGHARATPSSTTGSPELQRRGPGRGVRFGRARPGEPRGVPLVQHGRDRARPGRQGCALWSHCPGPPGPPGGAPWSLGVPGHTHRSESGCAVSSAGARATARRHKKRGEAEASPVAYRSP